MIAVPVYNTVIIPHGRIIMPTERYHQITGKDPERDEKVIFFILKEDQPKSDMTEDSFYPIGVSGFISKINQEGYLVVRTTDRVNINQVSMEENGRIQLNLTTRPDVEDVSEEQEGEKLQRMKQALNRFVAHFPWGRFAHNYISQWNTIGELTASLSMWLGNSAEDKYAILAEDSKAERDRKMEEAVYEYIEMSKLANEAESEQEASNKKMYRKAAIQKQMQYLQKELDEMDPENVSDLRRMELKIEDAGMNDDAEREARKVLNRLKQEGQNSAESGMLYDYLDFVTSLSWKKEMAQAIDLNEAEKVLDEDHFGLKKVKDRIIQQVAVMKLQQKQSGSILLFVGAPGTGKTSNGKSIANALHREYVRVSLGGVRDEADIRGHRRTYIGAMPGRIMDGIAKSGVSNPVMVLDEVDKLSASYNGDPASALLEVLDPEQNSTFTDHYMNVPYDLSDELFICTANSLDTIPEPLLNRMEVISFSGYTAVDKFQIARRHLIPRALQEAGMSEDQLEISDATLKKIIDDYTMEAGVRGLKKRIDTLCRAAAVQIVRGRTEENGSPLRIRPDELRDYLDMRPESHEHILEEKSPGIVTGLAWTTAGGEILFIETKFTKGNGKVIITGQLGDVMKESVQIAISLVKSMFPEKADLFEKNDLHVPAGAVPKDGPSAGITLTTAIASLVTGHAVSPEFAMTGEVALRGVVTPIGGLPEKLMAAERAGISTVFIPAENEDDLRNVDEDVRKKLTVIPVKRVTDVLERTHIISPLEGKPAC